mgnify:CR=1 FL=1
MNVIPTYRQALRCAARPVRWSEAWVKAALLAWQTRRSLPRLAAYTQQVCRGQPQGERQRTVLAIVGGYPLLAYVRLGYNNLGPYYNPNLFFHEVHYFQYTPTCRHKIDLGYPMFIHYFRDAADVARICRHHGADVLRAYDPRNGVVAIEAARQLGLPVLVSVH